MIHVIFYFCEEEFLLYWETKSWACTAAKALAFFWQEKQN